jgi:hypothetical protein
VGHDKFQKSEEEMTHERLVRLMIKNVSAVQNPANRKKFLVVKADETAVTAVAERDALIDEYMEAHPNAASTDALNAVYLANPDLYERCRREETVNSTDGKPMQGAKVSKASNKIDVEAEVARRAGLVISKCSTRPTFDQAVAAVFEADPELFAKYRRASYA